MDLVKVNDGSGELARELGEGAEKTGEVKGTDKTYDMFASLLKVKDGEKWRKVQTTELYFLSLAFIVGIAINVYPLRDTAGVPKSVSLFISKFVLLSSRYYSSIVQMLYYCSD